MVEHIIALRAGLGVDHVTIRMDSGDPPLFERSSSPLVEAFDATGTVNLGRSARYVTVKEPVAAQGPYGSFLVFLPAEDAQKRLFIDCAVDFRTAIGKQRIRFEVTPDTFRHGAAARTNTTFLMMLYVKTIGKLFADTRNLGYTTRNILVAGRHGYVNKPQLLHEGKSLEAVWHRATLDLLAAVALIGKGRLAGRIISYKAGHELDCRMVQALSEGDWLVDM
jgi:UDP-3-O-acyl-N-acetylglucosamine deacetylase